MKAKEHDVKKLKKRVKQLTRLSQSPDGIRGRGVVEGGTQEVPGSSGWVYDNTGTGEQHSSTAPASKQQQQNSKAALTHSYSLPLPYL